MIKNNLKKNPQEKKSLTFLPRFISSNISFPTATSHFTSTPFINHHHTMKKTGEKKNPPSCFHQKVHLQVIKVISLTTLVAAYMIASSSWLWLWHSPLPWTFSFSVVEGKLTWEEINYWQLFLILRDDKVVLKKVACQAWKNL